MVKSRKSTFGDLIVLIEKALEDKKLTEEENNSIIALAEELADVEDGSADRTAVAMQELHGLLGAIAADGKLEVSELRGASDWLEDHREELQGIWPFDEVDATLTGAVNDEALADREQFLLAVCSEFLFGSPGLLLMGDLKKMESGGVCACLPQVDFDDQKFCFTGKSERASRIEIEDAVVARGGSASGNVVNDLDYLVVGSGGNTTWKYRCYGRKIEKAMKLCKSGKKLVIVHELDFWDAVEDVDPKASGRSTVV